MRLFITGATGFIGSAIIRNALIKGWQVLALVRSKEDASGHLPKHPQLTLLQGNLPELPLKELKDFAADTCLHCAWITTPGLYRESPVNREYERWTIELLKVLPEVGISHFAMLGSCIEYQLGPEILVAGETPVRPLTAYAEAKVNAFQYLQNQADRLGLTWLWARIFYPYGAGEHANKLCSSIIQKLRNNESVHIEQPGAIRDYIHIDDLASAMTLLLEKGFEGEVNLGTGRGVRVEDLAKMLAGYLGKPHLIQTAEASVESGPLVADINHLQTLGWTPEMDLQTGLKRLCEHHERG